MYALRGEAQVEELTVMPAVLVLGSDTGMVAYERVDNLVPLEVGFLEFRLLFVFVVRRVLFFTLTSAVFAADPPSHAWFLSTRPRPCRYGVLCVSVSFFLFLFVTCLLFLLSILLFPRIRVRASSPPPTLSAYDAVPPTPSPCEAVQPTPSPFIGDSRSPCEDDE
jgi:hypothetical protein